MKIETKYNIGDKVWIVYEGDFYNSSTGERQNSCEVSIYTDKIVEVTFYENGLVYNFENYPDELKEDEIILYDEKDKLLQKIEELMNKINEREGKINE